MLVDSLSGNQKQHPCQARTERTGRAYGPSVWAERAGRARGRLRERRGHDLCYEPGTVSALESDKHPATHLATHSATHADSQHDLPYPTAARRVLLTTLIAQCGIVVTGALVRLTGSGLGCPTWPECTTGSLVPVAHQAQGWHKYIEFGNRLLTFVLTFACIASLVVALRTRPRRRSVVVFSALGLAGVAVQAILGGLTVLAGLHPLTVAAHFLVSGVLIYFAYAACARAQRPAKPPGEPLSEPLREPVTPVRRELAAARVLSKLLVGAALVILTLGTIVTGSGPHSGDAKTTVRFDLEPRVISWLHADTAIFFLGVLLATVLLLRVARGPLRAQRRAVMLLALALGQGLIGYVQYFTGLPELLVALHVLGAILVWVGALQLHEALLLGDTVSEPAPRTASEPAPAPLPQPAMP